MDEMIEKISRYPNGTFLRISWEGGNLIIEGEIDTVYETDNGLEEDEDKYLEFYACTVTVKKIINNSIDKFVNIDDLVEVSIENPPTSIELGDGTLIWKNIIE
jgi:hypothetical protein